MTLGFPSSWVSLWKVVAFALADRIVGQNGATGLGDDDGGTLIEIASFAIGAVAGNVQHARKGAVAVRQVHRRADEETRLRLEVEFLDAIAVEAGPAGDLRTQRRALGKAAELAQKELPPFTLPPGELLGRLQRLVGFDPAIESCERFGFQQSPIISARGADRIVVVLGGRVRQGRDGNQRSDREPCEAGA